MYPYLSIPSHALTFTVWYILHNLCLYDVQILRQYNTIQYYSLFTCTPDWLPDAWTDMALMMHLLTSVSAMHMQALCYVDVKAYIWPYSVAMSLALTHRLVPPSQCFWTRWSWVNTNAQRRWNCRFGKWRTIANMLSSS